MIWLPAILTFSILVDDDGDDNDNGADDDDGNDDCHQVWSSPVDHHSGEVRRHLGKRAAGNFNFFSLNFSALQAHSHLCAQDGYGSETYADGGTYQVSQVKPEKTSVNEKIENIAEICSRRINVFNQSGVKNKVMANWQ